MTPSRPAARLVHAACVAGLLASGGCVRATRMCVAESGCGAGAACVAGRCLSRGATPAIAAATRKLYEPVDVAYLRPGQAAATEGFATLGRGDGALVLLRFSVPLSPETTLVEAYLVIDRATDIDSDPAPVLLRTERVAGGWDSRTTSWVTRPALEEFGGAETRVSAASASPVRLEVRALVERWRRREPGEMGVAIVADSPPAPGRGVSLVLPARLELYVK